MPPDTPQAPACAPGIRAIRAHVLAVGAPEEDAPEPGDLQLVAALRAAGWQVPRHLAVPATTAAIRTQVLEAVETGQVEAIWLCGGVGLGPEAITPAALAPLLSRRLPGFGELLRQLMVQSGGQPRR